MDMDLISASGVFLLNSICLEKPQKSSFLSGRATKKNNPFWPLSSRGKALKAGALKKITFFAAFLNGLILVQSERMKF